MTRPNTFLSCVGKKRSVFVRRPDDQAAALPQHVVGLLDHVDLQLALAAAGRQVQAV